MFAILAIQLVTVLVTCECFSLNTINSGSSSFSRKERFLEITKFIPDIDFDKRSWISYQAEDGGPRYKPTAPNIIIANGYPAETHFATTEDGYILELHRIPSVSGSLSDKLPVLLMHGNFQSSADWVLNSPANASLAFILANNGYDVWIGNHRGNTYSTKHTDSKYKLKSHRFWDFSFHEMGKYDVPAMLDYITRTTSKPKVHYLSFSMGTTAFFAGMSLRPELSQKVGMGIAMGTSVFQEHFFFGLGRLFSFTTKFANAFMTVFGAFPILPQFLAGILHLILPIFCNPNVDLFGVCHHFLHIFFGHDGNVITKEQLPLITSVAPASSGFKTWNHFLQLMGSGKFAQYDYGLKKNLQVYSKSKPPNYNVTNVQVPIALLVGLNDFLAHHKDASRLAKLLPNLVDYYEVPYKKFTHLDFTYGRDVAVIVYNHILNLLQLYQTQFQFQT